MQIRVYLLTSEMHHVNFHLKEIYYRYLEFHDRFRSALWIAILQHRNFHICFVLKISSKPPRLRWQIWRVRFGVKGPCTCVCSHCRSPYRSICSRLCWVDSSSDYIEFNKQFRPTSLSATFHENTPLQRVHTTWTTSGFLCKKKKQNSFDDSAVYSIHLNKCSNAAKQKCMFNAILHYS